MASLENLNISGHTSDVAGNTIGTNGTNGTLPHSKSSKWVPVYEQPLFTPTRKLKIVCIGAGFSGLTFAYKVYHDHKMADMVDLVIYEKNPDVGGTWFENKYPGVGCDIPSHSYSFPFAPNPDWTKFYSPGPEIQAYMKQTSKKYDLDKCIQFSTKLIDSVWDEASAKWRLKVKKDGKQVDEEADIVVSGAGILNKWQWPKIPGLFDFKGKLLHTASWDTSYQYEGKKIAVIGNGSSAIQIVPVLQRTATKIVNYIRSPTWISGNFCADMALDGKNFTYTEEQKRAFRENPKEFLAMRKKLDTGVNTVFHLMIKDSPLNGFLSQMTHTLMQERMGKNPDMLAQFTPKFGVGCRRLTPGDGYLEALQEDNARYDLSPIVKVTEKGIETEAGLEEFDLIVCATGFDASFTPSWNMVGRDGVSLNKAWEENPEAYFATCAANMPNYFMIFGPNCPIGHGTVNGGIAWSADYILKWCRKMMTEDIKSIVIKTDVVEEWNVYAQEFLQRTVWNTDCRSWYKNNKKEGRVTAMYPGSTLHYKDCIEAIRGEDFDIRYASANRFRFMGNGSTIREANGEDNTYYMVE